MESPILAISGHDAGTPGSAGTREALTCPVNLPDASQHETEEIVDLHIKLYQDAVRHGYVSRQSTQFPAGPAAVSNACEKLLRLGVLSSADGSGVLTPVHPDTARSNLHERLSGEIRALERNVGGNGRVGGWLLVPTPVPAPCRVVTAELPTAADASPYAHVIPPTGHVVPRVGGYEHVGARFRFQGDTTQDVEKAIISTASRSRLDCVPT